MKFVVYLDGSVKDENGKSVFQSSISQQDAREVFHKTIAESGYIIDEEWEMDDDSIEITTIKGN